MKLEDRRLWATIPCGSRLYGTAVEGSDTDILNLYIPDITEMVDNRHVTLPQCIKDGVDSRHLLLGDFVMSLGTNVEHMTLAYHFSHLFGDLQTLWLNGRALHNILNAAENMWANAKTPKNRAHAYRYTTAAWLMARGQNALYPLECPYITYYMDLRNDTPEQLTDEDFKDWHQAVRNYVKANWKSNGHPDRKRLAEWVMLRYLGLHG